MNATITASPGASTPPSDAEREATIRSLFPLVRTIARRIARIVRAADFDDLIGDGSIGLIRAVDAYDPVRGATLMTYARRVIAGSMLNGLRRLDPVSERARRILREAHRKRYELAQERGTMPSLVEMESVEPRFAKARLAAHRQTAISLDAPLPFRESGAIDFGADPARIALQAGEAREVIEAIALLPERQRNVVALHYYNRLSLHAIGARLGVSSQRISQLHLAALARLRTTLISR